MARSFSETGHVRAQAKFVRSSSRKARLVLAHVRGLTVPQAKAILEFSTRDIARDIELVLRSAAHNAEVNHGLDSTRMVVHEAFADEGTTMKRFKPRARGRASKILKRTTHITIVLAPLATAPPPPVAPVAAAEPEVVENVPVAATEVGEVVAVKPKPRRKKAAAPVSEMPGDEDSAITDDGTATPPAAEAAVADAVETEAAADTATEEKEA